VPRQASFSEQITKKTSWVFVIFVTFVPFVAAAVGAFQSLTAR